MDQSMTTTRNTQSNSEPIIQNGHLRRTSTSLLNQGSTQRPRAHAGPYPFDARTGSVLRPNRSIITIKELQGPTPELNKIFAFVQLLQIKAGGDASTDKATLGTYNYYAKGMKK